MAMQIIFITTIKNPTYELDGKAVLGRTENVYLSSVQGLKDVPFTVKIDTGAETTSYACLNIFM
ncbi:hypothetical protein O9993_07080 [Vibrio lentus]|nr:hypothetical protein [Vibrio lentus]